MHSILCGKFHVLLDIFSVSGNVQKYLYNFLDFSFTSVMQYSFKELHVFGINEQKLKCYLHFDRVQNNTLEKKTRRLYRDNLSSPCDLDL